MGLIDEAKALLKDLPESAWPLAIMAYQEVLQVLDGKMTKEQAVERNHNSHRQ